MPIPSDAASPASKASASKAAVLAELRGRIRRMEGIGGADGSRFLPLGVPEVDRGSAGGRIAARLPARDRRGERSVQQRGDRLQRRHPGAYLQPSGGFKPGSDGLDHAGRRSLRAGNRRLRPEAGAADRRKRPARLRHPVGHGRVPALPLAGGGAGRDRRYRHGRQPPAATGGGSVRRHRPAAALRRAQAGRHRVGDALGPERRTQPAHRWRAGAGAAALADAAAPLPGRAAGRMAAGVARRRLRPGERPGECGGTSRGRSRSRTGFSAFLPASGRGAPFPGARPSPCPSRRPRA